MGGGGYPGRRYPKAGPLKPPGGTAVEQSGGGSPGGRGEARGGGVGKHLGRLPAAECALHILPPSCIEQVAMERRERLARPCIGEQEGREFFREDVERSDRIPDVAFHLVVF